VIDLRYPYLLLLLLPALWFTWRSPYRWGIPHSRPSGWLARVSSHLVPALLALCLILAAAGPEQRRAIRGRAPVVDFAMVLDGSSSMKAMDDGKEDRWTAARRLLRVFIANRPDDRFSLILFSAHPVTLSPLTADHVRLWRTLERLELDSRDDGTAIGSALMTAVRRLAESPARSRVILLLTDGAQNRGRVSPQEAAQEAKSKGIRIHTVAIGKASGESLYPVDGNKLASLKVETDPATLQGIAHTTGGEALAADDPQGLARSLKAIDQLEKTALPVDPPSEGTPLARWFLVMACIFAMPLTIDIIRKRGKRLPVWMGEA